MNNDFVVYIDTDSCYISLENFILQHVDEDKWNGLSQEQQLEYIKKITKPIEEYVNKRSFEETQKLHYNSQVEDFQIVFEQEKIALSALFSTKKRYAT
jgi:DNA polymerase elongation subunit (family B)